MYVVTLQETIPEVFRLYRRHDVRTRYLAGVFVDAGYYDLGIEGRGFGVILEVYDHAMIVESPHNRAFLPHRGSSVGYMIVPEVVAW